jgi:hypothetical protein
MLHPVGASIPSGLRSHASDFGGPEVVPSNGDAAGPASAEDAIEKIEAKKMSNPRKRRHRPTLSW